MKPVRASLLCALIAALPLSLAAQGGAPAGAAAGRGPAPSIYSNAQLNAISGLETNEKTAAVTAARTALNNATFAASGDRADIGAKVGALAAAELDLAMARADAFAALQASANKLSATQVTTMSASIGRGARAGAAASAPIDYADHTGFESLFDGTMNGWDGAAGVWSIKDGAFFADTTVTPGANFLFWKGNPGKDFELRMQVKLTGTAPGGGIMYRSRRNNDTYGNASVSGYQYDLGGRNWAQLVDQNGRGIIGSPGEGVLLLPGARHVRIADLGGATVFDSLKQGDWNQVHIIASGNTVVHILNGKIWSVGVDEDPSRIIENALALQVEGTGQEAVRDIWLKKL